jgi:BirA family transcriptional regulator, biotin operon repressor / biotin---[acetyl-CoA-carboxylase] ligase
MDWAREVAAGTEPGVDAFRLRADRQTAGRGRRWSLWRDAPGRSLLTTVAIRRGGRFDPGDPNPATIALRAGNAIADLVAAIGVPDVTIKWPNDIIADDRKLCGILVEADPRWFYLGIGLNVGPVAVRSDAEDGVLQPVSLNELLSRPVSPALPRSLLDTHLRHALDDPDWHDRINRRLAWKGAMVSLAAEGRDPLEGRLLEVDRTGGVRILCDDGTTVTAVAGTLRRRDGEG